VDDGKGVGRAHSEYFFSWWIFLCEDIGIFFDDIIRRSIWPAFRRKLHSDGGMQRAFLGNHWIFCMGILNCGKKKRKKRKNSEI
jgi:hypothetical protein